MKLRIVTPTRSLVDAEVSEITAPGSVGEFGVFSEHVSFLGGMDVGVLHYVEDGTTKSLVIEGGYAEVVDDVITILANDARTASDLDAESVREQLSATRSALDTGSEDPAEVDRLLRAERLAEAELSLLG